YNCYRNKAAEGNHLALLTLCHDIFGSTQRENSYHQITHNKTLNTRPRHRRWSLNTQRETCRNGIFEPIRSLAYSNPDKWVDVRNERIQAWLAEVTPGAPPWDPPNPQATASDHGEFLLERELAPEEKGSSAPNSIEAILLESNTRCNGFYAQYSNNAAHKPRRHESAVFSEGIKHAPDRSNAGYHKKVDSRSCNNSLSGPSAMLVWIGSRSPPHLDTTNQS
ncbi:hypothetical protein LOZ39_003412, partial [Ophidiomyces ophidiicola]